MLAWALGLLASLLESKLGMTIIMNLLSKIGSVAMDYVAGYFKKNEVKSVEKETVANEKEAVEKGDLDEIKKSGEDLLNGNKP